ncbi:MAG: hypothetical protein OXC68_05825 [Aestuariivita sp.]|nr:hypothetical protein [Aestuariivita sp.]
MIKAPGKNGTRSEIADWLEIRALLKLESSSSIVMSVASTESEDHGLDETESGNETELEITEKEVENGLDIVAYELGFRNDSLNEMYPFKYTALPSGHFSLTLDFDETNQAHQMYVFMLLVSGVRDKRIALPDLEAFILQAGTLFHVCASIGVAGLMHSGQTFWFGFPRPDGTNFLDALRKLSDKLKFPKPKQQIPAGMSAQAKDEEIDIVGWRPFVDNRIGGLIVLCQAASGSNWSAKSIISAVPKFSKTFFTQGPYGYGVGAMAMPFMAHHDVELTTKDIEEDFEDACYNRLWSTHSGFGVILDRIRIVQATNEVFSRADHEDAVAGIEKYVDLTSWSKGVLDSLAKVAA